MRKLNVIGTSFTFFIAIGCGATRDSDPALTAPLVSEIASGISFSHSLASSHFHLGANVSLLSSDGFLQTSGDDGVFQVDQSSGAAFGVENAASPANARGPLTLDSDAHNQKVLDYMQASGLPMAEVARVHANTIMSGGVTGSGVRLKDSLVGFTSVINRQLGGVRVSESFALARFNADGETVHEAVYWPAIPSDVVGAAAQMSATVADPRTLNPLLRLIQGANPEVGNAAGGEVVIHHSPFWMRKAVPDTVVTYDVIIGVAGSKPRVRHFDSTGAAVVLPSETKTPLSSARP
jgi:hypothetical protein